VTTLCIFFIVLSLLWFMVVVMQWSLGAMEALSITVFVGMSCDYCLHIAHAFMHSNATSAPLKVREALAIIGNSVLGAAVTTFGSCIFLLLTTIVFFYKMGIIIAVNTICSLWFALVFFPSLLTLFDNGKKKALKVARASFGGSSGNLNLDGDLDGEAAGGSILSQAGGGGGFASANPDESEMGQRMKRGSSGAAFEMTNLAPNADYEKKLAKATIVEYKDDEDTGKKSDSNVSIRNMEKTESL